MLAVAPFVGGHDDAVPVTTEAAGSMTVRAASVGSPTAVRELLSETTSTLVAATGATTTSTSTTSTTSTTSSSTSSTSSTTAAPTSTTAPAPTTTAAATTAAAPTTAAPTTTVHRHPATTTTTRPPATTTTTAAPSTTSSSDSGEYAYDDPRSTQVWYDLAGCESGGNWSIDTGNGYYGGLQFSLATWESVGGTGYPHEHPAQTQIEMGRRLQARQGWGAWPHCAEELGLR